MSGAQGAGRWWWTLEITGFISQGDTVWEEVRASTLRYTSFKSLLGKGASGLQKAKVVRGRESRTYCHSSFMDSEVGSIFKVTGRLFRPNRGSNGGRVLSKTWRSHWCLQCDACKTLFQLGLHYLICLTENALGTLLRFYVMYIQTNSYVSENSLSTRWASGEDTGQPWGCVSRSIHSEVLREALSSLFTLGLLVP